MNAHREPTAAPATGTPPPAVAAGVGVATAGAAASTPAGAALPAGHDPTTREREAARGGLVGYPRELSLPDDLPGRLAPQPGTALSGTPNTPPTKPTADAKHTQPSPEPGGRGLLALAVGALNDKIRRAMTRAQRTALTCTLSIGPRRTVVNLGIVNLDHPHECPLCGAPVVPCHRTEV